MAMLAYAIEFLVLRRLVNQEGIILFMATLGIANFLDGFGPNFRIRQRGYGDFGAIRKVRRSDSD